MSPRVRIFGWGNLGRGDDGVALLLCDRLRGEWPPGEVAVHAFHQLGPEVVELLTDCDQAIFIDAHVCAARPDVCVAPLSPAAGPLDSHHCSPGQLLALAQALQLPLPQAWLVTVRARDLGFGRPLSRGAQAALAAARLEVERLVEQQQPA